MDCELTTSASKAPTSREFC
uniref:Uncharacterized protein n=1 Tax=Anguilla anguilla TaxID=7936 RepID=A0A0E9UQG2_ANGAN